MWCSILLNVDKRRVSKSQGDFFLCTFRLFKDEELRKNCSFGQKNLDLPLQTVRRERGVCFPQFPFLFLYTTDQVESDQSPQQFSQDKRDCCSQSFTTTPILNQNIWRPEAMERGAGNVEGEHFIQSGIYLHCL